MMTGHEQLANEIYARSSRWDIDPAEGMIVADALGFALSEPLPATWAARVRRKLDGEPIPVDEEHMPIIRALCLFREIELSQKGVSNLDSEEDY